MGRNDPSFPFHILWTIALVLFAAGQAGALVAVTHTSSQAALDLNDIFTVDIFVSFDGVPADWESVYTSSSWDPMVIELIGATSGPDEIFAGPGGSLKKVYEPRGFPCNPTGTLRTVGYAAGPGEVPAAGADTRVAVLTFRTIGLGDASVAVALNEGEGVFAAGNVDITQQSIFTGSSSAILPEPGTAVLLGFGMAVLSRRRNRNRRAELAPQPMTKILR